MDEKHVTLSDVMEYVDKQYGEKASRPGCAEGILCYACGIIESSLKGDESYESEARSFLKRIKGGTP